MKLKSGLFQQQKLSMTMQMRLMIRLLQLSSVELLEEVAAMLESCVLLERNEASSQTGIKYARSQSFDKFNQGQFEELPAVDSLHDILKRQLDLLSWDPVERLIAEMLIDGINDNGYLVITPEEVLSNLRPYADITLINVFTVLQKIQQFEPVGIGARTYQECISLQLMRSDISKSVKKDALLLVEKCYPYLSGSDYLSLKKKSGLSTKKVDRVMTVLKSLNPFPGREICNKSVEYLIPDVIVLKRDGFWDVSLNLAVTPSVSINRSYVEALNNQKLLVSTNKKGENEPVFWKQQLKDANSFVRGLNNRYFTLLKVMRKIVYEQYEFLERGDAYMRPLLIGSVALELNLHESTISRVVQNKYVQLPQGIVPMSYFFSPGITDKSVSSVAVRAQIKKFILNENPSKPLSDAVLAKELKLQLSYNVARRTVAKYRKILGFASSRQRKTL